MGRSRFVESVSCMHLSSTARFGDQEDRCHYFCRAELDSTDPSGDAAVAGAVKDGDTMEVLAGERAAGRAAAFQVPRFGIT